VPLRPFNASLTDARGILTVDRATFNECPYSPERIVRLLTAGEQQAWVAEVDGHIVGFVAAFPTRTLRADSWEVDLLAVHPRHRRQGIGRALIRQAVKGAAGSGATQARAAVAVKNQASRRAFEAVGFQPLPESYHLMRCDVAGAVARPPVPGMEAVRPLAGDADAKRVLQRVPSSIRTVEDVIKLTSEGSNAILVAERDGHIAAFAELVQVQTLLYAGAWVETLVTPALSADRTSQIGIPSVVEGTHPGEAASLIAAAVEWTKAEGLDEIGCLVAARGWRLREAFVGEGFISEGEYLILAQAL
jgi:ribosomal protein S18 acetylase RimI-like enzyme